MSSGSSGLRLRRRLTAGWTSLATAGPPRIQPLMCLLSPRSVLGAEESLLLVPHGPALVPRHLTAVIAGKIKHIHFQKESKYTLLPTIRVLPLCSQSLEPIEPLAKWAEALKAIANVSEWVISMRRRGY